MLLILLASLAGAGFCPKAPGTVGSAVGLFFLIGCLEFQTSLSLLWLALIFLSFLGWFSSYQILKGNKYKDNDPSYIVIDEAVGIWLTVLILLNFYPPCWQIYLSGFVAFRFFDILKPWPIGWLDRSLAEYRSTAALGIMIDDLVAGLMAALSVKALDFWLRFLG